MKYLARGHGRGLELGIWGMFLLLRRGVTVLGTGYQLRNMMTAEGYMYLSRNNDYIFLPDKTLLASKASRRHL